MRQPFITENFLLGSDHAVELYHGYARDLPIVDFHCHLPPAHIAADRRFENLTQIWLSGDHYKWRLMRAAGVPERYCTGDAPDREKFQKWAETVPQTLRNPAYHWTHLELRCPLGVADRLLNASTADGIWRQCNEKLASPDFSARGIMRQMNVAIVCTTDDPTDTLEHHRAIAADESFAVQVLPTFRPDRALAIDSPDVWNDWIDRLAAASDIDIADRYDRLLDALLARHDFFHAAGCRLADHGLETFWAADYTPGEIASAFRRLRQHKPLPAEDAAKFRSAVLYELASMNCGKGWTQQFHFGALRNNNSRMFAALGPDSGYDSIGDFEVARPMARFLDRLDRAGRLTKTILYNLNPAHNDVVATMLGNFQDGTIPGKMQIGSGWWFLDQRDGIQNQLNSLSNQGLLSRFVGMVTDSRSFLSYPRHEYFRRILCNLLGDEMHRGLLPDDIQLVGPMVSDICYRNPATYFQFPARATPKPPQAQ
ncbi:MAG: glucuronate isomerase [Planctomycetaceae bacterium]|nr:glucuronate isomerase [Planctomycetaceae bacterium]